jgi:rhodanese-related sulfurtransferase
VSKRTSRSQGNQGGRRTNRGRQRGLLIGAVAILAIALVVGGIALLNRPGAATLPSALPSTVSAQQAYSMVLKGAFILDVRTQAEWDEFHLQGATLIPLDQLSGRLGEVPRDRDILVVCRSGGRSQNGRDVLIQNGYTRVTSLSGGLTAWSAMDYPIEGKRP